MTVYRPTSFAGIRAEIRTDTPGHFFSAVEADLLRIASGHIGYDLLEIIDKRSRGIGIRYAQGTEYPHVTVCYTSTFTETSARTESTWADYTERKGQFGTYGRRGFRKSGGGHFMWVGYCPNPLGTTQSDAMYSQVQGIQTPAFVVLAHELIHAWHGISGTMETREKQTITTSNGGTYELAREEAYTVGLGTYANTRISENAIRAEHRLPRRTHYASPNDFAAFAPLPHRPGHAPTGQELKQHLKAMREKWAKAKAEAEDWW